MFCMECGASIETNAKFCPKCGTAVNFESVNPSNIQPVLEKNNHENVSANNVAPSAESKSNKTTSWVIAAVLLVVLGVYMNHSTNSTPISGASEIIKDGLKSPASFSLVSSKEIWNGKTGSGRNAHIVQVEYDAQNGFGATIRGCNIVAFWDKKDGGWQWDKNGGVDACDTGGPYITTDQIIQIMIDEFREH